jgi:hypothetical protein
MWTSVKKIVVCLYAGADPKPVTHRRDPTTDPHGKSCLPRPPVPLGHHRYQQPRPPHPRHYRQDAPPPGGGGWQRLPSAQAPWRGGTRQVTAPRPSKGSMLMLALARTPNQHDQAGVSDPTGSSHPTVWPPSSGITGVRHHSQSKETENLVIKFTCKRWNLQGGEGF